MHLSSLPSPYGIGTMGKEAYEYADFLAACGFKVWQILPVCPPSVGDSPYSAFSSFAGNPYFIDLDRLKDKGLLEENDYVNLPWFKEEDKVDYEALKTYRMPLLKKAAGHYLSQKDEDYFRFCEDNGYWLEDYARFMTLKESYHYAPWTEWPKELRSCTDMPFTPDQKEEFEKQKVIQYFFFTQWMALKKYVNEKGISFIGDLPIYAAMDSADVWSHQDLFALQEDGTPAEVAGCPPDGFSANGQKWGNPLYRWDVHKQTGYRWWEDRISHLCKLYDQLRIDHFKGFDSYFCIPADGEPADGHWEIGPRMDFFNHLKAEKGELPLIAEDLGYITPSLRDLLNESGFPGMKILEFAFDSRDGNSNLYLPHNYITNCVAYTGTHDNDTLVGWMHNVSENDLKNAKDYFGIGDNDCFHWRMMMGLWSSVAGLAVVQMQDLLGLDERSRMNIPSTVGINWMWRMKKGAIDQALIDKVSSALYLYGRHN